MSNENQKLYFNSIKIIIYVFTVLFFLYLGKILAFFSDNAWLSFGLAFISLIPYDLHIKSFKRKKEFNYEFEVNKNAYFAGVINYSEAKNFEAILLNRKTHRDNILKSVERVFRQKSNKFKGLFLIGESGSGKSILINYLKEDFIEEGYEVYVQRGDYHSINVNFINNNSKKIIILDHFQKALENSDLKKMIKKIYSMYDCVFIFSFPDDFFSRVKMFLLDGVGKIFDNYVLTLDSSDVSEYIQKIADAVNTNSDEIKDKYDEICKTIERGNCILPEDKKEVLCYLLCRVAKGYVPLIQLECIGNILCKETNLKRNYKEVDFINDYLETWVKTFEDTNTAYAILKLFCEFNKYSIDEIRLATFIPAEMIEKGGVVFERIKRNMFLLCSEGEERYFLFEPKHEFVTKKFREFLEKKPIASGQNTYISILKNLMKNDKREEELKQIEKNYKNYHRTHKWIYVFLCIMLVVMFIVNLYCLGNVGDIYYFVQHMCTLFVCFPTTLYIFCYCYKILYVKKSVFLKITCVFGGSVIILCNYFMDWWGFCMGGEIIVLSISIFLV